jgi:two-component system chemotaxis response regulator CheY
MKAMIIDDSRTMRRLLASYIANYSMDVVEAEDGLNALEKLQGIDVPALALVDWDMPRMCGLDFIKTVRADPDYADMKILMISSHNTIEDVGQALAAGATDFLMKPMTEEMLHDKLQMIGVAP